MLRCLGRSCPSVCLFLLSSFLVDICVEVRIEIPSCSHFMRDSLWCQVLNARAAGVRCQPVQRRWRLRGVGCFKSRGPDMRRA